MIKKIVCTLAMVCVFFILAAGCAKDKNKNGTLSENTDEMPATEEKDVTEAASKETEVTTAGKKEEPPIKVEIKEIPARDLKVWLKADAGIIFKEGKSVMNWRDHSGNGLDAKQSDLMPHWMPLLSEDAINGKPAVSFNGKDQFLAIENFDINNLEGMTIFLVSSNTKVPAIGGPPHCTAVLWAETSDWGCVFLKPTQDYVNFRFGTTQEGNEPEYKRPVSIGTDYSISMSMKDKTTDSLYVNGKMVVSESGKLPALKAIVPKCKLGMGIDNLYFHGKIAEFIVYTRAISEEERKMVEKYLSEKYAIKLD